MLEAGIVSGDLLIVDRSIEVKNNSIVVAYVDGEFTVKRFQKIFNKVYLKLKINSINLSKSKRIWILKYSVLLFTQYIISYDWFSRLQ